MNDRWPPTAVCGRRAVLAGLLLAALTAPAQAHRVNVWACVESGSTVKGSVGFPGGGKARGVTVTVLAADGSVLGQTTTDDQGEFSFQARFRCDHTFAADVSDGHAARYTLRADELPDTLPPLPRAGERTATAEQAADAASDSAPAAARADATPSDIEAAVEKVIGRQVIPLRREIEQYRHTVRVHDVLGGIGYIVGVCGLVFYLKARAIVRRSAAP